MKLKFARQALADLNRLNKFVSTTAPNSLELAAERLLWGFNSIKKYPNIGYQLTRLKNDFRELLVPFGKGNYVIRYRIHKTSTVVLHIWHSRENRKKSQTE